MGAQTAIGAGRTPKSANRGVARWRVKDCARDATTVRLPGAQSTCPNLTGAVHEILGRTRLPLDDFDASPAAIEIVRCVETQAGRHAQCCGNADAKRAQERGAEEIGGGNF